MFESLKSWKNDKHNSIQLDSITGLLDRKSFIESLHECNEGNFGAEFYYFGLAHIEQFKLVNHSLGHEAGDYLLQKIAERMKAEFGENSTVGRMGSDEFGFISLEHSVDQVKAICQELNESLKRSPLKWKNRVIQAQIKYGIVSIKTHEKNIDQILKSVDEAVYAALYDRIKTICEYDEQDTAISRRNSNLKHAITVDQWLARDQFVLFVQPIVDLHSKLKINYFEVLIRGKTKDGKLVPPSSLIAAAEEFNLATKLDKWVIRNLFSWISHNKEIICSKFKYSFNISALSLNNNELCDYIIELTEKENIDPQYINIEVTERIAISNIDRCLDFMNRLKKLGFTFSLDDFGTGYCSFNYIKSLPFDMVKIDGTFIKNITSDKTSIAIVKAVADIAHTVNKKTVAEFVEDENIANAIKELGIDYGQGYFYSRPVPIDVLTKFKE